MTIETKYNIGDKVWFQTLGINYKAEIIHISIEVFQNESPTIHYNLHRNGYAYERHEDELFLTKEELLKSL
jgi:hypothetical protein